ncbi:MAG: ABC transporter substrate-binding protein [Acidimicrobiia bacterium]|nr:ABC transporter substrate-binding protein [Acidimicrobiia bacterium]
MRKTVRNRVVGATFVALALVLSACASGDDGGPIEGTTIEIGSFGFGESEIIGEIYKQALEAKGYSVNHQVQVGPREVLKPALESGEVHFIPEYVGSGLEAGFGIEPSADADATRDLLIKAYEAAGVAVLDLAPAEDKNTFVVTRTLADELGLSKVSDLSKVESLILGGPPECPERPRCQIGLESVYGLEIAEFKALDAGGSLTVAALNGGEIDVGLFFTTYLFIDEFLALEDDLGLQPAENIVPVVRQDVLDEYGDDLADAINEVSAKITTDQLIDMNERFFAPEDADVIARDFLVENGFIDA